MDDILTLDATGQLAAQGRLASRTRRRALLMSRAPAP